MTGPATARSTLRRNLLLAAAWIASAAAAVGLGVLAVSLVGATASPVAATTSAPAEATEGAGPRTSPSATGEQTTAGGTVYAHCGSGRPVVAGVPAPGWLVDHSPVTNEVEFRSGTQKIEVRVVCAGDTARFSVEGPRQFGGDGPATRPPGPYAPDYRAPTKASPADASPDDDPGSDDSSGRRGSGGHGSDD